MGPFALGSIAAAPAGSMEPGTLEILGRLALAAVLGLVIGFDREKHDKPAGVRTLMMVSFGAAVITIAGVRAAAMSPEGFDTEALSRYAQGVIGGIGFLGAGVIITHQGHVRGVTTAAGLWVTAGVGIACGMGMYVLALLASLFAVLTFVSARRMPSHKPKHGDDTNGDSGDSDKPKG